MLSVDELYEAIKADLAARSITALVEFGSWKAEWNTGANRVVVGLGDYVIEPEGAPNAPGVRIVDQASGAGARSLFSRRQVATIWVHGQPPGERDPERSLKAHRATSVLLHQVLGAIYRFAHGSLKTTRGTWPTDSRQDFVFGSLTVFYVDLGIPVLDDLMPGVAPDTALSVMAVHSVDADGETELVAEIPEPTP